MLQTPHPHSPILAIPRTRHCRLALLVVTWLVVLGVGSGAYAAVLTLDDGTSLTVEQFTATGTAAQFRVGTESRSLPLNRIRDLSFADRHGEIGAGMGATASAPADLVVQREKAVATLRQHPDATMVLVVDDGSFVYRADGTNTYRYRSVVYVAKEEALGVGAQSHWFDKERNRVKVLHARSMSPDGVVHELDPQQIRIAKSSGGSEFFDNYLTMSYTVPGVEVGSLVDVAYETEEFNPFDRKLWQCGYFFQGSEPVVESIMRVVVPHDQPLHYVARCMPGNTASPTVESVDGNRIYTWRVLGSAPLIAEPRMPPESDVLPRVNCSLQKEFDYMFSVLKPMHDKRFQASAGVKAKVEELVAGAKTLEEKIGRLYTFCQRDIRYISIKGNLSSNQVGHAAEETLRNRYGDCTDKGMLLATMLECIGVKAWPVGIRTNDAGTALREIAVFDSNHCITEVELHGQRMFLDSTASDYRFPCFRADDHGTLAVNVMTGQINPVPVPPPASNAMLVRRELEVAADGTTVVRYHGEMTGTTEANQRGALRSMKPEEYEKEVRESVAGLAADYLLTLATFTDPLDLTTPLAIDTHYTLRRYAPRSGRIMIFSIPFMGFRFPEVSLPERRFDIVYRTTSLRTDDVSIVAPAGFAVKYLPPPLTVDTPYLGYTGSYVQEPAAGGKPLTVRYRGCLEFRQRVVPVADYAAYKAALEKLSRYGEERIFFEEVGAAAPADAAQGGR